MDDQNLDTSQREPQSHIPCEAAIAARLVGESAAIRQLRARLDQLAASELCLLVTGETGVGKELLAREIHSAAVEVAGRSETFVVIDGPSLVGPDAEIKLFGRGTGPGLDRQPAQMGPFERARGGTVFIDHVDELLAPLQAMLSRVIEAREVTPVGAWRAVPVDVRVIASAGPIGPKERGSIREDLYYRLAEQSVEIPPLRRRTDDIRPLAAHFLAALGGGREFSSSAYRALEQGSWPGNVRELKAAVRRAALASGEAREIGPEWLCDQPPSNMGEDAPLGHLLDLDWEHAKEDFGRWYWTNIWHKLLGDRQRIAEHTRVSQVWLRNRRKIYELPDAEALTPNDELTPN